MPHGHVVWHDRVWFDPAPAPTTADLVAIESAIGARLPPSFVEFLRVANGASCDYALTLSSGGPLEAQAWFTDWFRAGAATDVTYGTLMGEVRGLESAWFREHLPERFLPIARTGGENDTLLIDLTDSEYGTVLAWMTGLPPGWGAQTENVLHVAARSFDDLIAKLYISDEIMEIRWPPRSDVDRATWLQLGPRTDPSKE